MKKIASLTMVVVLLLGMFTFNVSAQENVSVYIEGAKVEFDVQPQIINRRTMVPMRKIFEELGATVNWDNSTQTAIGTKGSTVIKISINDYTLYKNDVPITLDVPAQLIDGRTLVPVRAISESFGCSVKWEDTTQSVLISSNSYYAGTSVPTYTSVTGVPLKDTLVDENGTIYRYDYTQVGEYNEFSDYIVQLVKDGWTETNKRNTGEMLIYYFSKNGTTVMVGYVVKVDEVWVSVT